MPGEEIAGDAQGRRCPPGSARCWRARRRGFRDRRRGAVSARPRWRRGEAGSASKQVLPAAPRRAARGTKKNSCAVHPGAGHHQLASTPPVRSKYQICFPPFLRHFPFCFVPLRKIRIALDFDGQVRQDHLVGKGQGEVVDFGAAEDEKFFGIEVNCLGLLRIFNPGIIGTVIPAFLHSSTK